MENQFPNAWEPRLKKLGRILAILFLILIISVSLFTILSPFFGWRTEVVISGSMEPALKTGSVVIVRPVDLLTIQQGDIVMFSSLDKKSLTTHRVVKIEQETGLAFITKGDANNNPDITAVSPDQVVGIVAFTIPYLGFLAGFIKTPLGFILFFLIPAVVLLGREMLDIWRAME
ncbi:MAG: signal peptidase I [Methanoregulaceae archaeon]|jgi:signal peptidase|nr:signal peptidase I [Methanoregulaceae archaeon]